MINEAAGRRDEEIAALVRQLARFAIDIGAADDTLCA